MPTNPQDFKDRRERLREGLAQANEEGTGAAAGEGVADEAEYEEEEGPKDDKFELFYTEVRNLHARHVATTFFYGLASSFYCARRWLLGFGGAEVSPPVHRKAFAAAGWGEIAAVKKVGGPPAQNYFTWQILALDMSRAQALSCVSRSREQARTLGLVRVTVYLVYLGTGGGTRWSPRSIHPMGKTRLKSTRSRQRG